MMEQYVSAGEHLAAGEALNRISAGQSTAQDIVVYNNYLKKVNAEVIALYATMPADFAELLRVASTRPKSVQHRAIAAAYEVLERGEETYGDILRDINETRRQVVEMICEASKTKSK